jgi:hypothetical protein
VYPGPDVLQEVGRITIAGSRLDLAMASLWHHLDRYVPYEEARKRNGSEQDRWVRVLADARLVSPLHERVMNAMRTADDARKRRNDVIHQDWVLDVRDQTRSVQEMFDLLGETANVDNLERQARESTAWKRIPPRKVTPEAAPSLEELIAVERALASATDEILTLTFVVASSRETGLPVGYVHPE